MSSVRDFLKAYWPLPLVFLFILALCFFMMKPAPPRTIKWAAGSPGGTYYALAEQYRDRFAEDGVTIELVETKGSIQNLSLLNAGDVDVGIVQGGLEEAAGIQNLYSLGGVFYEPFWVFVRADTGITEFDQLRDKRLAIGPEGSGTRALSLHLQSEFGGGWAELSRMDLSGSVAADALIAGGLDGATFSASVNAPYVKALLAHSDIALLEFETAPALARRTSALADVALLSSVSDVGQRIPAEDVPLIASVAQLVVHEDLHPALQTLLLESASSIHRQGSLMAPPGTFPDAQLTDLDLSRQAARYYKNGPSALRRYFSFGWANFLERAWILLIPLLTLAYPLAKTGPPVYRWRTRRKIYVWYADIRALEVRGRAAKSASELSAVTRELEDLQVEIGKLEVPLSYTDDLYRLRSHVEFVKQLINNEEQPAEALVG